MVTNVTSFSRSGLSDFVLQRASAVVLAVYTLCVVGFFLANPDMTFDRLHDYFSSTPMKLFSTLALIATAIHAWIGMWTIGTDYIMPLGFGRYATALRFVYQATCVVILFVYVLWGLEIFWSF